MAAKVVGKKLKLFLPILAILLFAALLFVNLKPAEKISSFGHSPDYSWVKGQLEYSGLEGGFWLIRYGDESDQYGGKFVLGNNPKLSNFKNGDLVKIKGQIAPDQVSIYQAGRLYTIESIELLK